MSRRVDVTSGTSYKGPVNGWRITGRWQPEDMFWGMEHVEDLQQRRGFWMRLPFDLEIVCATDAGGPDE